MSWRMPLIVTALFVASALAGCLSGGDDTTGVPHEVPTADGLGTIIGLVTDDQHLPIAGAQATLLNVKPEVLVTTDQFGAFRLSNVEPGRQTLAVAKFGYDSVVRYVDVKADGTAEVEVQLSAISVSRDPIHFTLIGEGYFSCGAYILGVTSWGNLHACVFDDHKPRYNFEAAKDDFMGVIMEITWTQSTALTSQKLYSYLDYKPVCDPFCGQEARFAAKKGESPIRHYADMESPAQKLPEDPIPLSSMTFPAGDGQELVIVFQQRMTHFLTLFYHAHGDVDEFSAIPDA